MTNLSESEYSKCTNNVSTTQMRKLTIIGCSFVHYILYMYRFTSKADSSVIEINLPS